MDLALSGGISFASLISMILLGKSINKDKKQLDQFEKTKTYTPSDLIQYFNDFKDNPDKLRPNPDNLSEYISTNFVEGYVHCDNPFTSIINKRIKLVYSYYYKDPIYSNDTLMDESRLARVKTISNPIINNALYFDLIDPQNPAYKCLIHRNTNVDANSGMEKIAEERRTRNLSWIEKLLIFFGALVEFTAQICKSPWTYRGIKIGWIENEFGVRVGSGLTAFGDIIFNLKNGSIRMEHPLYFVKDRIFVINKLRQTIYGKRLGNALLALTFLVSGGFLAKRLYTRYQEYKVQKERAKMDKLRNVKHIVTEKMECIICADKLRNVIADPCHHLCMCYDCYTKLPEKTCPMCKSHIRDITEIFIS